MPFLGEKPGFTRRTWAAGIHAGGVLVKPAPVESTLSGVWRPFGAIALERLSEGDRARDPRYFVTRVKLQFASQGDGIVSDHISPPNDPGFWEVQGVKDGTTETTFASALNHYTYELLRVQEPDG